MKCPNDASTLLLAERHGVEIDYCPECRGVWLDRGELDKVRERSASDAASDHPPRLDDERSRGHDGRDRRDDDRYADRDDRDDRDQPTGRGRPRKRRSFLDELMELGG